MNNWIEWTGGKQPVGDEVAVEVKLACGTVLEDVAYGFDWCKGSRLPIVAYRVLYDIAPNYREPAQGSDWVEWDGGKQPVGDEVVVEVALRDGHKFKQKAGAVDWTRDFDRGKGDVMEYRVLGSEHNHVSTSKYARTIRSETVDVYDVLKAFDVTNPALQHLIKKALCVGIRGHKTAEQDYQDIIDSAIRAKELH